jgi:hypothetical protein
MSSSYDLLEEDFVHKRKKSRSQDENMEKGIENLDI